MQAGKDETDRSAIISTAWIFLTLNYLCVNILKLMGGVGPTNAEEVKLVNSLATPQMLLGAAIYLETAMVMIVLSHLLRYAMNRWANIVIATLHISGTIASLFVITPPVLHIFFVIVELSALLFIVWYAWTWTAPQNNQ